MFWQLVGDPRNDTAEVGLLEGATNAEAIKHLLGVLAARHLGEPACSVAAKVFVLRALDDAKECLIGAVRTLGGELCVFIEAPHCPASGSCNRVFLVGARVEQGRALVESEHDVGAELMLNLHRDFGRETVGVAVNERLERHAVFVDACESIFGFRDDLKVSVLGFGH